MKYAHILSAGLVVVLAVGCRKSTPVDEVSIDQSGLFVTVRDTLVTAEAWPQWRGLRGDGHAPDQPVPIEWNDTKNVYWSADVPGRGHGSPIVIDVQQFLVY